MLNPSGRAATASLDKRDAGNMGLWEDIVRSLNFIKGLVDRVKVKHSREQNSVQS